MFIITHKKIFLAIGAFVIVASMATVGLLGLKLGIDFTGGALTEVSYGEPLPEGVSLNDLSGSITNEEEIEAALAALPIDLGGFSVRRTETDDRREAFIVRTRDLTEDERITVHEALIELKDDSEILRFTSIGPVIGQELKDKAVWAIGAVCLIIILYVAFAFRGVSYPVGSWVYGGITILALVHDVIVPAAAMALLGTLFGIEVDVLFVMALLAVLGYSVNDTIVVFDRVRENLLEHRQEKKTKQKMEGGIEHEEIIYKLTKPFEKIVGEAVEKTILRSINTSVTTSLALAALYFVGGAVTQTFAFILLVGVVAGTYSSIFLASPMLVWWADKYGAHNE